MKKCKYPNCAKGATYTWATVPLCKGHHDGIKRETDRFYKRRITFEERVQYLKIVDFMPWEGNR